MGTLEERKKNGEKKIIFLIYSKHYQLFTNSYKVKY